MCVPDAGVQSRGLALKVSSAATMGSASLGPGCATTTTTAETTQMSATVVSGGGVRVASG